MPYYGIHKELPKNDKRQKKWASQRKTRGFDDTECWNLDYTFTKFILPRLKRFREITFGYPGCLNSIEEWYKILDEMIEGFELAQKDISYKKESKKINKALRLFSKWYFALWY